MRRLVEIKAERRSGRFGVDHVAGRAIYAFFTNIGVTNIDTFRRGQQKRQGCTKHFILVMRCAARSTPWPSPLRSAITTSWTISPFSFDPAPSGLIVRTKTWPFPSSVPSVLITPNHLFFTFTCAVCGHLEFSVGSVRVDDNVYVSFDCRSALALVPSHLHHAAKLVGQFHVDLELTGFLARCAVDIERLCGASGNGHAPDCRHLLVAAYGLTGLRDQRQRPVIRFEFCSHSFYQRTQTDKENYRT